MSVSEHSLTTVKIPSKTPSWNLDAWLCLPIQHGPGPFPVIVMAHGFSANKLMGLATYAFRFCALGYACVVFDYRRWGASDGTPRHVLYVSEQLDDYRTVIKWCRQHPQLDPQRVVAWGSSFSGAHVITLAAEHNLALVAAIAQCPYTGTSAPLHLSASSIKLVFLGILDVLKQALGLAPVYVPAAAAPGQVGLLVSPDALAGMLVLVNVPSDYPNTINASSLFEVPFYHPASAYTNATASSPLLVIATEEDSICPIKGALELARKSPRIKLVRVIDGHFDIYPGRPQYPKAFEAQTAFLHEHVPIS